MTWTALAIFSIGNALTRTIGMFVLGRMASVDPRWTKLMGLIPIAVVAAVFSVQTFTSRSDIVLDARVIGVAAASVAVWRRAPMVVVVLVAAGVTAGVRALHLGG